MKKITEIKSDTKKRIMGGVVYMALAATVVAFTIGSVVTYFEQPQAENVKKDGLNGNIAKEDVQKNDNGIGAGSAEDFTLDTPVSDSPSGIDAKIDLPEQPNEKELPWQKPYDAGSSEESVKEEKPLSKEENQPDDNMKPKEASEDVFYGYDGFIKPCGGFIGKEFSAEVPVYSVSMADYRAHMGIDIVNEVGTPVKASSNGVIERVYNDYLYGTTVVIEHKDGIKTVYSNLSPDLPADTVEGRAVITGEIIAGIGESAVCEASEAKHLHFEMIKDGVRVNPEDYLVN